MQQKKKTVIEYMIVYDFLIDTCCELGRLRWLLLWKKTSREISVQE